MIKIFVVEDDTDLNRFVSASLRNAGYEVVSCFNGLEALEKMDVEKCDLLLTDIMMPKMNGFELAESVRSTDKTTPIIFMTAKDDKPSKMLGYNIGIDEYVTKPFDIDILLMTIKAILRRAKIETEKEIKIGNFYMNVEERTATIDGEEIIKLSEELLNEIKE